MPALANQANIAWLKKKKKNIRLPASLAMFTRAMNNIVPL